MLAAEDAEWIAFRHALLAEAVYADLLPGELAGLHRQYLQQLTANPTLGSKAEMAHHALRSHDLPAALSASHAAAMQAAEVLAPTEELRHLETVLQLWDAVPDAADRVGRSGSTSRWPPRRRPAGRASRPGRPRSRSPRSASRDPLQSARFTPAAALYLMDDGQEQEALDLARTGAGGARCRRPVGGPRPVAGRARPVGAQSAISMTRPR